MNNILMPFQKPMMTATTPITPDSWGVIVCCGKGDTNGIIICCCH